MTPSAKGFTLIELMISITIISILVLLAVLSYQNLTKKGRDAKRASDLRVIQGALQQFYADNNYYPFGLIDLTGSPAYINSLPTDPQSTALSYNYVAYKNDATACDEVSLIDCQDYCLYAATEILTSQESNCTDVEGYNYEITSP